MALKEERINRHSRVLGVTAHVALCVKRLAMVCAFVLSIANSALCDEVSFRQHVAPILLTNCLPCHNERTKEGDYSVATINAVLKPGDSGEPPVVATKPKESELFRRLTTSDDDERMPAESDPLPSQAIDLVAQWIEQGAHLETKDRSASLASILPVTVHPQPPSEYRFPIPLTAISFIDARTEEADAGEAEADDKDNGKIADVIVGGYHELIRWSLPTESITQRIPQVGQRVYDICYSAESQRLYVASGTPGSLGEVRVLNSQTGELVGVPLVASEVIHRIALHPAGHLLAAAGGDHRLTIIDLRANRVTKAFDSHSDWVRSVAWSDDGDRLATASRDKTAKIFSLESDEPIATYNGHGEDVMDVCFEPGRTDRLVSCDAKGDVHFWTAKEAQKDKSKSQTIGSKRAFRLLPSKDGVWVSAKGSLVKFSWTGKKKFEAKPKSDSTSGFHFSIAIHENDAASKVAAGDSNGFLRIWNAKDGKAVRAFRAVPTN